MVPSLRLFAGPGFSAARTPITRPILDAASRNLSVKDDWQVTDLISRGEQEPGVVFTEEAINETTTQMLGTAYRVEEPEDASDANAVMQAAEAHMIRNPMHELMPVLRTMLRDPEIQRATISHLRRNADFQRFLRASPTQALPAIEFNTDASVEGAGGEDADGKELKGLIENLARNLRNAGESALQKAAGIRNALGRLLISLGANLHALLGQPFSQAPIDEKVSDEEMDERAEIVGQALITVAVAILSIVFLKRAHIVM